MKKKLKECYHNIKPDDAARERMLANILVASSEQNKRQKKINKRRNKARRSLKFAAAFALVLVLPAAAVYASGFFRLHDVKIGKAVVGPSGNTREADMISLQGLSDSPEAKACDEWNDFYWEYDRDGAILSQIGNRPTGVDASYEAYNCYTQEMADKVDEICEKYQLTKMTGIQIADTYETLCSKAGIGDICGGVSEQVIHSALGGYFYEDGSFGIDGEAFITGTEGSDCKTDYQFCRAMKGSFSPFVLNVEDINAYEQWVYTTRTGETVLLANSGFKALILLDQETSFVTVNVLGDILEGTFDVSDEKLEALADSFDFTAVGR